MAAIGAAGEESPRKKGPFYTGIFFQTVMAMIIGGLLGYFFKGQSWITDYMDPLGKAFIKLVKMIIAPVIFLTISIGIANMRDMGSLGRVAAKAMGYFLFFSTLALIVGLAVGNAWRTGDGMNLDQTRISTNDASRVSGYSKQAHDTTVVGFLTHIIPDSFVGAFTGASTDPMVCAVDPKSVAGSTIKVGEATVIDPKTLSGAKITCSPPSVNILQVVFVAVLFGIGLALSGKHGEPAIRIMTAISDAVFKMVNVVMRAAPLGALGAFAFLISDVGIQTLVNLAQLVVAVYATSALFILFVLGAVALWAGFSIFNLLRYLKEELFLVIATSSSESALPALMRKMEAAGCSRSVVGLVVPTGYSFNLDGTNIYMTLAALFLAQATNVHLSIEQQLLLLAIAMLSSKGAAGVTGAGFIALAATLEQFPVLPLWTMGFILGVDRFLSQCRSLTNFIGNAVATVVVSRWEGALDRDRLRAALRGRPAPPLGALPVEQDPD